MIIEKVSRSGAVLDHFQFTKSSINIGRAYDNDLILHDVHVEGSHLSLNYDDANEGFWFKDLGSVNGTQVIRSKENKHKKVPDSFICSGDTLCIGKTYLKVRSRVQDVPASLKISVWDKALSISGSIWCVSLICLALLGLETLDQFISDPRMNKLGSKALESLNLLFIVIGYGVGWAFVARVQKMEPRLLVHASLVGWCMLFFSAFGLLEPIIYFNFDATDYAPLINFVVKSVALFLVVWTSVYLATELKKVFRFLLASLIPIGLLLGLIVGIFQKPEFVRFPQYDSIVVSPAWQWRDEITRDEYIEKAAALYRLAEKEIVDDANEPEETE